mmetsp:Transcript_1326/g.4135  ORF Transcript_1326/g.4135 Transcript_1326/m.4135 type:complete len:461 (+) Transcript_1326:197-1579(+)
MYFKRKFRVVSVVLASILLAFHSNLLPTLLSRHGTKEKMSKLKAGEGELMIHNTGKKWSIDSSEAEECLSKLNGSSKPTVTITTFSSHWLQTHKKNRKSTILEKTPTSYLWIFHEDMFEQRSGSSTKFETSWSGLSTRHVCFLDIFKAVPSLLQETLNPESGINKFLDFAKAFEPFSQPMKFKANHLLIRKLASIYYAINVLPEESIVLWLDSDVTFEREVDHELRKYVQSNDISYIPVYHKKKQPGLNFAHIPELSFKSGDWWVETGVFSVKVSIVTRLFFQRILELYSGDLERIARSCVYDTESDCRKICSRKEVYKNLYMNDIFLISLLMHSAIHKHMCILQYSELLSISHGWFSAPSEKCFFHNKREKSMMLKYPHPNFCPRTNEGRQNGSDHVPQVSPFPIFKYFMHHMGYTGTLREKLHNKNKIEGWLKLRKSHLSRQDSLLEKIHQLYEKGKA